MKGSEQQDVQIVLPYVGFDGLVRLVFEARELYVSEVVVQKKTYLRYVNDLLNSIQHHDAYDARSKNEHTKNVQILAELLRKHQAFVKHHFSLEDFTVDTVREMIRRFNMGDVSPSPNNTGQSPSSSNKTAEQNSCGVSSRHHIPANIISLIVHCANEADLFVEGISTEYFASYYAGSLRTPPQARKNTEIVEFFDYLAAKGLIEANWQHVIDRDKLIMSSSGRSFLTKGVMASTLSRLNAQPASCSIRRIMDIIDTYIKEHKIQFPH